MPYEKVKISPKVRHENIPCTADHFEKYLRDQALPIVHQGKDYVRVRDAAGEEWGFFSNQFDPCR